MLVSGNPDHQEKDKDDEHTGGVERGLGRRHLSVFPGIPIGTAGTMGRCQAVASLALQADDGMLGTQTTTSLLATFQKRTGCLPHQKRQPGTRLDRLQTHRFGINLLERNERSGEFRLRRIYRPWGQPPCRRPLVPVPSPQGCRVQNSLVAPARLLIRSCIHQDRSPSKRVLTCVRTP